MKEQHRRQRCNSVERQADIEGKRGDHQEDVGLDLAEFSTEGCGPATQLHVGEHVPATSFGERYECLEPFIALAVEHPERAHASIDLDQKLLVGQRATRS